MSLVTGLTRVANVVGAGADLLDNIFAGDQRAYLTDDTDNVIFDAVTSDIISYTAQATSRPVEGGSTISDHVSQLPDTINITATLSNYSSWINNLRDGNARGILTTLAANLGAAGAAVASLASNIPREDTTEERVQVLQGWKEAGALLKYVNEHGREITRLVIESISSSPDGDGKEVSISMKRINLAESLIIEIDVPQKTSGTNESGIKGQGSDSTTQDQAATRKSWAKQLIGG